MKLRYDESFDGGAWPGSLGDRDAVFGEQWVGPLGLLDRLETMLGLGGLHGSEIRRVAEMARGLRSVEGPWSRSLEIDPVGVARRVLRVRDELVMAGWRGEAVSPRLELLAQVSASIPGGTADRFSAVVRTISSRRVSLQRLELTEPIDEHPRLLAELFRALEGRGTIVDVVRLEAAQSSGDLCAARSRPFIPAGDGTLELVRPYGPLVGAEDLAAWLAARDALDDVVVIGADELLDRALARFGLPTIGAGAPSNGLLVLLPLVLGLAFDPIDPNEAYRLLAMPMSPVPRSIARRLIRALEDWPSTSSDAWRSALATAIEGLEVDEAEEALRWIDTFFTPSVSRQGKYPRAEAERRAAALRSWAVRRMKASDVSEIERAALFDVREQCDSLAELLAVRDAVELDATELFSWVRLASDRAPVPCAPEQVGMHAVDRPDAIVAPARTIVWWRFQRAPAAAPEERVLLTAEDRERLGRAGVRLSTSSQRAARFARRVRRPLEMATDALLLICPSHAEDGDAQHPHPLWDEIESAVPKEARAALRSIIRSRPALGRSAPVRAVVPREPPASIREWKLDAPIETRPVESPSSMAMLIECSLRFALQYVLNVRPSGSGPHSLGPLVYGKLAHAVFERLLSEEDLDPECARARAEAIFDRDVASLVPELVLPGRDFERSDVRRRIATAAVILVRAIHDSGARIRAIEETIRIDDPLSLEGRPDLVLDAPPIVLDVKWQKLNERIESLRRGTSLQLAAYAKLMQRGGYGLAYLTAYSGDLVVLGADLPSAQRIDGPTPEAIWKAAYAAYRERCEELARGELVAAGNTGGGVPIEESGIDGGRLVLTPPCRFCDHAVLCGHAYEED